MEKKRKKKNKGAIRYAISLALWILILAGLCIYGWKTVMRFGDYWEMSQVSNTMDDYLDRLRVEMWQDGENGVLKSISSMPHPFQTDEECVAFLQQVLSEEIRYLPSVNAPGDDGKTYDLVSGRSKFGKVHVSQIVSEPDENFILNWMIEKYSLYPWQVDEGSVEFYLDGLYTSFEITIPDSYTLILNGHTVSSDYIIESGIHYNTLENYYEEFEGLPTKVTYHVDQIFGTVDYQLLDASGNPTEIDPDRDDSQFIQPVSAELYDRFYEFSHSFAYRYLEFSSGTDDMHILYGRLKPYVQKGSDLEDRLVRTVDSYIGWQHNKNFRFYDATLNSVTALGNGIYVLDVSASGSAEQPSGFVKVDRNMLIYIRYNAEKDDAVAFSVEDY